MRQRKNPVLLLAMAAVIVVLVLFNGGINIHHKVRLDGIQNQVDKDKPPWLQAINKLVQPRPVTPNT